MLGNQLTLGATLIAITDEDEGLALERFKRSVVFVEDLGGHDSVWMRWCGVDNKWEKGSTQSKELDVRRPCTAKTIENRTYEVWTGWRGWLCVGIEDTLRSWGVMFLRTPRSESGIQ